MTIQLQKHLTDALYAANDISKFLDGVSQSNFFNNQILCRAIEREFEILGEALNLASKEKEDLELVIPDLWKIIGLRNRIIHGYDSVRLEVLWDVYQEKIPSLSKLLEELLK